jgi:hypothetical protein
VKILVYKSAHAHKFHVCLKPVISALTVSTFPELIEYFFDNEIFSESNICYSPAYFQVAVIPFEIRKTYLEKYQRVLNKISSKETFSNTNLVQSRFKDTLANSLHNELMTAYNMIQQPEPENVESLQQEMVWWLSKWDKEFGHNAKDHYPEWNPERTRKDRDQEMENMISSGTPGQYQPTPSA